MPKTMPAPAVAAGPFDPEAFVRVTAAARRLSLSRSTLYVIMDSGALKYHKFGAGRRLLGKDLNEYVAAAARQG